jgi:hypothetical protein
MGITPADLSDREFESLYRWVQGQTLPDRLAIALLDAHQRHFHTDPLLSELCFAVAELSPFWGAYSYEDLCTRGLIRDTTDERKRTAQREAREAVLLTYLGWKGIREIQTDTERIYAFRR